MSDRVDISATIKVVDQASAPIGQMQGALQGLQNMARSVGQSFKQMGTIRGLGTALGGVGSAFGRLGGAVMSVVKPIAALMGITGGIGMAEAISGLENYVSTATGLSKMAMILGTTVEKLDAMHYAASRAGIGADEFDSAMIRANENIGKAAIGKLPLLSSLFDKLNISTRDSTGQMRTSSDILLDFADKISKQTDAVTKGRMATALFGRAAGPEMLKLLNQGAGGIQAYMDRAAELGLIQAEDTAKAKEYAAAQREVRDIWMSLSRQLSQNLLPAIKPLIEMFAQLLRENQKDIVIALTSAFDSLSAALREVDWKGTVIAVKEWFVWINKLVGGTIGWGGALAILALSMTGLLGPLVSLGVAFAPVLVSLGGLTLAALGFQASLGGLAIAIAGIVVAIGLLGYAAVKIYQNWDGVKAYFAGLWERVKAVFQTFVDWIPNWAAAFIPALFIYKNWDELTGYFGALWDGVKALFDTVTAWATPWLEQFGLGPERIKAAWSTVTDFFRDLWSDITGIFDRAWGRIGPVIDKVRAGLSWFVKGPASQPGEAVAGAGGPPAEAITQAAAPSPVVQRLAQQATLAQAAAMPAPARPSLVQQAGGQQGGAARQPTSQPVARVEGKVEVAVRFANAPPGTSVNTSESGQVRATGDVGHTMAATA